MLEQPRHQDEEAANLLAAGLPHLTPHPPRTQHRGWAGGSGTSSLSRLQTLVWEDEQSLLPPGPYLRFLQRLDTSLNALLASMPALAGADALETIGLECSLSSPHQLAAAL